VNEPSYDHADRKRGSLRRRLLVHAAGLTVVCGVTLGFGLPASTASPTVQDGRFLSGGTVDVAYSCTGADDPTNALLDGLAPFGITNPFPMAVTITSAAVEPSPSPGEDFDVDFTWDFTLDQNVVLTAATLNPGSNLTINGGTMAISPTSGATGIPGMLTANTGSHTLPLGDGTVPVGFTDGPHTGTFNRTAAVDEPIVFTPGTITSTVVATATLQIICSPGAGVLTMTDQDGVAPSTTTTTRQAVVAPTTTAAPVVRDVAQARQLPRTGSENLVLVVLAIVLIDLGYLALSASQPARRRRATSAL
jgi:hypothetical protein